MAMIEIGTSKQLFFDDYLIESLTRATRGLNQAIKVDDNPVLRAERPWEGTCMRPQKTIFDPHDQLFKMWYSTNTACGFQLVEAQPSRNTGRVCLPNVPERWNRIRAKPSLGKGDEM